MATRDVQFIIRARDEASRAFDGIVNALQQISSWNGKAGESSNILSTDLGRLVQALGSVDQVARVVNGASERAGSAFEQQRAKVKALEGDLANLKNQSAAAAKAMEGVKAAGGATGNSDAEATKVKAIVAAQTQLNKQIDSTSSKLEKARSDLEALGTEYQRAASLANAFEAAQPGIEQGQAQAAAAEKLQEQSAAAEALRQRLNPLPAIEAHYAAEIAKVNVLRKAGLITAQEELKAVKLLENEQKNQLAQQGVGPDGRPTLFGMKPWQLTNLSYQVNDVVSGFAMGQKPTQIIAQQLGQIIQLFPKLGSAIISTFGSPYFLGAAAVFASIAFAAKQAADQEDRLRAFTGILKANADGARYSAQALNDNVKALQAYHLTADEAVAITRVFIKDGLDSSRIEDFGRAAKDLSRVLGTDVKDAATQVADAFTGGYDAIAKLDDETNFLTATERDHIRTLMEQGKAAEARQIAFEKFQKSQHAAAEEMRGPWTRAMDDLGTSWEHLKQSIGDSSWAQDMLHVIDGIAGAMESLAHLIDRASQAKADWDKQVKENPTGATAATDRAISHLPFPFNLIGKAAIYGASGAATGGQNASGAVTVKLPPASNGNTPAPDGTTNQNSKETSDTIHQIQLQRELAEATSDAAKIRVAGEQAVRDAQQKSKDLTDAQIESIRKEAEESQKLQIQQQRRQGLLGFAQQFLGKRENVREDKATLEALFNQYGIKSPQGTTLDPEKVAWCAAFVNAVLAGKGVQGTGSLSAASFKSFGTGVNIDEAQPGDIVVVKGGGSSGSHVGFFQGFGPGGSIRLLGGNQGKGGAVSVANFKRSSVQAVRRVGNLAEGYDGQDSELQNSIALGQAQDAFNHKLETEAAQRALVLKYMREQLGMSAEALFNSQREEEIQKAIAAAKQEAADRNITFTPEQEAQIRAQVGATFDLEHATQLVNDRIKEQTDLRSALLRGIQEAAQRGDDATFTALTQQLEALKPALEDAIDKAIEFWSHAKDGPAKEAALEGFRQLRQEIEGTAAAIAKIKLDAASFRIQGAQSLQSALTDSIGQSQLLGDKQGTRDAQQRLDGITNKLVEMRQAAIDAAEAMLKLSDAELAANGQSREGLEAFIVGMKSAQHEAQLMGRQFLMTGRQINESIADDAISAVQSFQQKVEQGQNVFTAFWTSLVEGIAQFLEQIGLAILKQAIFNALAGGSGGGSGGVGGGLAGIIGGLFGGHHGGGIAGSPSMFVSASPAVFTGAMRYHTGGVAGLKPDEVPAILKKGEEVLTTQDPRHRNNVKGAPGGGERGIRQILAIGDDEIAKAVAGAAGEDVWLTHLQRNRATVRQMLSE